MDGKFVFVRENVLASVVRERVSAAPAAPMASQRPYVAESPVIERGSKLTLVSSAGAIVVQRPVVALQSASARDKGLFVQTSDGAVLSAPLAKPVK